MLKSETPAKESPVSTSKRLTPSPSRCLSDPPGELTGARVCHTQKKGGLRPPSKGLSVIRSACCLGSTGLALIALTLILARYGLDFDNEWVESSIASASLRVLQGGSLYVPPTVEFVGDNYPPLYFYVSAGLMAVFGQTLLVMRGVSLLATLLAAVAIWITGLSGPGNRRLGGVLAALFLAFYVAGGQVYDLARVDMPAIALAAWGVVLVIHAKDGRSAALAGVLMALAILTKHNMVMVGAAAGLGFLLIHVRHALIYGVIAAGVPLIVFGALHASTDGWSSFYLFTQPSLHPFGGGSRWIRLIADDIGHHGLLLILALCAGGTLLWKWRDDSREGRQVIGVLLVALGGLAVTCVGRLKAGGFTNNLVPAWTFGLLALAWLAPRVMERIARRLPERANLVHGCFWVMVAVQLASLGMGYARLPWRDHLAVSERASAVADLHQLIASLEEDGPVWVPLHSFQRGEGEVFAHLCPSGFLMDAPGFEAKKQFEEDVARNLAAAKWSAIILGSSRDRFVSDRCGQLLNEHYEERPMPDVSRCVMLSGKRTYAQRLFVRKRGTQGTAAG